MERKFPKNVRQVGNVCDTPKIYVEDYVDTYLAQLRDKASDMPVGALLMGESLSIEGQECVCPDKGSRRKCRRDQDPARYSGRSKGGVQNLFSGKRYSRVVPDRSRQADDIVRQHGEDP